MYDTVGAVERPELWASLDGRDRLTALFLGHGVGVAAVNVGGAYTDAYALYAVGVAAVLSEEFRALEGVGRVGVVLRGGNLDLGGIGELLKLEKAAAAAPAKPVATAQVKLEAKPEPAKPLTTAEEAKQVVAAAQKANEERKKAREIAKNASDDDLAAMIRARLSGGR